MGCNCKRGKGTLNNLKSKDHLKIAYDFYEESLKDINEENLDDLMKLEIWQVFQSLYPNIKYHPDYNLMIREIKDAANRYNSK